MDKLRERLAELRNAPLAKYIDRGYHYNTQDDRSTAMGMARDLANGIFNAVEAALRQQTPAPTQQLAEFTPIIEAHLKREMTAPANHQHFQEQAAEKWERWQRLIDAQSTQQSTHGGQQTPAVGEALHVQLRESHRK